MENEKTTHKKRAVVDAEPKRSVRKKIERKVKSGECLVNECSRPAKQRGLCIPCVQRFYIRRRAFQTEAERVDFEKTCIQEGLLLRPGLHEKLIARDPFTEIANRQGASK